MTDVYACAMRKDYNWLFNLLIPNFFRHSSYHVPKHIDLSILSHTHTIAYVGKRVGTLEYLYYNHLFSKLGLPLCAFANNVSLRKWMKWSDLVKTFTSQLEEVSNFGKIFDPIQNKFLTSLVSNGESIMISLSNEELTDDELFPGKGEQLLNVLIEASSKSSKPIIIIPIDFIWEKRCKDAEKSFLNILFGDSDNPGPMRRSMIFWRRLACRANAVISDPIYLNDIIASTPHGKQALKLRDLLLEKIKIERNKIIGEPMRPRSWFIKQVLENDFVEDKIATLAIERNKDSEHIRELARRYAHEIAADINYAFIEIAAKILGWVFKNLYDGLKVDQNGIEKLKELISDSSVVLVPNHKSHFDYLLLSYVLHTNNMMIPHVAAGLNLSFWPLGTIFRWGGAFFLKRSFDGNPLYKTVFEVYLQTLIKSGYVQEFFIEGGRSRTGRLMPPKLGMLSMLCKAGSDAEKNKISFVPVSFTYDRVIEEAKYVEEMRGADKIKERSHHLFNLLKYLRFQKHKYGCIYINLGSPVEIRSADANIKEISEDICTEINKNIEITPSALAACALLSTKENGITVERTNKTAALLTDWLSKKSVNIDSAIAQFQHDRLIKLHHNTGIDFFEIPQNRRIDLNYYKNGIIHYCLVPSLMANVTKHSTDYFKELYSILGWEFFYRPTEEEIERAKKWCSKLNGEDLSSIANIIRSHLETYLAALTFIQTEEFKKMHRDDLTKGILKCAKDMILLGKILYIEGLSKHSYNSTVMSLNNSLIIKDLSSQMGSAGRKYFSTNDIQRCEKFKELLEKILCNN